MKVKVESKKVSKVIEVNTPQYILTLSERELTFIKTLCGKIRGSGNIRSLADGIYFPLTNITSEPPISQINSSLNINVNQFDEHYFMELNHDC